MSSSSAVVRKGTALLQQVPRAFARQRTSERDYLENPPILCNSVPKSGTHLLAQILGAIPGVKDFGSFIASTPTLTQVERSAAETSRLIRRMVPLEIVRAHLFHGVAAEEALRSRNVAHFIIHRDPRDIVCSEAHYLGEMNRWHRLHKYFKPLSPEDRIELAITGDREGRMSVPYPGIAERYGRYVPWIQSESVCPIRFEDLVGGPERLEASVSEILRFFDSMRTGDRSSSDFARSLATCCAAISPKDSHTYREGGGAHSWRRIFSERNLETFRAEASSLLAALNYGESDELERS